MEKSLIGEKKGRYSLIREMKKSVNREGRGIGGRMDGGGFALSSLHEVGSQLGTVSVGRRGVGR